MEQNVQRILQMFGGLALFLYAMEEMSAPLQHAAETRLRTSLQRLTKHPVSGLLAGALVTAVLQSSSVVTVVVVGLVSAGLLDLRQALPVIFGANIGTTITAVLASLGQSRDAKRTALAHCIFNLSGAVVFGLGLPWFIRVVQAVSPQGAERVVIARQIANAHTLFNGVCALCWLPLTGCLADAVNHLLPEHRE